MRNNIVRFTRNALSRHKRRVVQFCGIAFLGVLVSVLAHSGIAFAVVYTTAFAYFCTVVWKAIKAR